LKHPFIINFKNYEEVSSDKAIKLAKAAESIATRLKVEIIVAPPQPSLALIAKNVKVPVICQHVDDQTVGPTTGFFVPEIAKSYGAVGSLINHSEHRIEIKSIASLVERLRKLGMTSIVCAREPGEVMEISTLKPDFIAIEPPELIGSGRAVSKENPAIITNSIHAAESRSQVICGAGITDKEDVSKAMELGSKGILVASGIIKAKSWDDKIDELTSGMKKH
jgi:triosephosphate isomerase (TIM)